MSLRGLLCAVVALVAAPPVLAAPCPTVAACPAAAAPVIVELVLNGVPTGVLVPVEVDGDRLRVDAAALHEAGVATQATGRVDVAHLAGFTARYEPLAQTLLLDVPPALLPVQRIAGARQAPVQTVANTGALLAYDAYAQHAGSDTTASLWTEQRLFGGFGTLSSTGVVRAGGAERGYVRYDTRFRLTDERRLLAVTLGDLYSNALAWSSSVRMGGVQIARSFRARPDLVTVPLPRFAGQAALPTGVELFVDGYRQSRTDVAPGRFVLDDIPVVNGAGSVTVVTTDAVGRQVATTVPFYVAPDLLRPGLTDFSFEAGALRRGYALRSFAYGRAVASASVRHGVSQRLTVEAHGEASRGLASAGAGILWSPGIVGAVHGAVAASRRDGLSGWQLSAGYAYQSRRFTVGVEHLARSDGYADLATFDLATWRGAMRSDRASGSVALGRLGSIGVAYVDARGRDGYRARLASMSWSAPVGGRVSVFANANYDIGRRSASAQLRLLIPLGRASATVGASAEPGRGLVAQASVASTVPAQGGVGGSADAAVDRNGRFYGQATGGWRTRAALVEAGVAVTPGNHALYASASGAVIAMGGGVFAANAVPDSFAVVDTGVAGVPVSYENQPVGVTDRRGRLFVPGVAAYHAGRYAIDTLDLAAGTVADRVERQVALRDGAGAVVSLPVRERHTVLLSLVDVAGRPLAAGGEARLDDGTRLPIGWDGVVALDAGTATAIRLAVTRHDGGACLARVDLPRRAAPYASLAGIPCR